VTVPAASHQLYRNPALAMTFLELATRRCLAIGGRDPDAVGVPPFAEIVQALNEMQVAGTGAAVGGAST
jgi:hypothetical protein